MDRASKGESITITRAGKEVAELRALARPPLSREALLSLWHRLPPLDPTELRKDIDSVLDSSL